MRNEIKTPEKPNFSNVYVQTNPAINTPNYLKQLDFDRIFDSNLRV